MDAPIITAATPRTATYTATAGQTAFPVPFAYFAQADVRCVVYRDDVLIASYAGGDGSMSCAPTANASVVAGVAGTATIPARTLGDEVVIYARTGAERDFDFSAAGVKGASVDREFNRRVAVEAELREAIGRAPVLPHGVSGGALERPADGYVLGWLNGAWRWMADLGATAVSSFMQSALVVTTAHAFAKLVDGALTVQTTAALRELSGKAANVTYHSRGHTTAGDGGEGTFRYDPAATDTVDGGTILANTAGGNGRLFLLDRVIYPEHFGAFSSAADNRVALEAWAAATATVRPGVWPGRTYNAEKVDIPTSARIFAERGATLRRKNAATANYLMRLATGASRVVIAGYLELDGNKANQTIPATNLIAESGCYDLYINLQKTKNAKASGGSYGGGMILSDSADHTNGTKSWFHVEEIDSCDTYGLTLRRAKHVRGGDIRGKNCGNAVFNIEDTTLPVPASATNYDIRYGHISGGSGCGSLIEIFGARSGVSADGYDIFSTDDYVTRDVHLTFSADGCTIYGAAFQGEALKVKGVASNCGTAGQLYGGVLWNAPGSEGEFAVYNPKGIGIDMGISRDTRAKVYIEPGADTVVAVNCGAAINPYVEGTIKGGADIALLGSGWDGADNNNWASWLGRDFVAGKLDIEVTSASDQGVVFSNGFDGVDLGDITIHMKAAGRATNLGGADRVTRRNVRVIDETSANPANWTDVASIASASAIQIEDHERKINLTGTATVNTIKYRGENDYAGALRVARSASGSEGTLYANTTAFTYTGDVVGVAALPVRSNGKIYGGYITNPGSGGTTLTLGLTNVGSGSGAAVTASIGPANRNKDTLEVYVLSTAALGNGTGNMYLLAAFAGGGYAIDFMLLRGVFNNFVEGRG